MKGWGRMTKEGGYMVIFLMLGFMLLVNCYDYGSPAYGADTDEPFVEKSFKVDETNEFNSLIVKFKKSNLLSRDAMVDRLSRFGEVKFRKLSKLKAFSIVKFDRTKQKWTELKEKIMAAGDVEYVEPNYIMRVYAAPNDPYYTYQWNMQQLRIPEAWDITMGRPEVKVAVIDSGVAYKLDDFADTHFDLQNDWDFVANDDDAYDEHSHGTHCTGTIAQSSNNNNGTIGIAPNVTILPLRAMGATGVGVVSDIADALIWAADHGAHIVTLSLGGGGYTNVMNNALRYAYEKGITIFAASGNDGSGSVSYPAAYDNYVIAVGAVRYDKQKARYSQYGNSLDIVAPGGDMSVDQNGDGYGDGILQQTIVGRRFFRTDYTPVYAFYEGTSMASPHAAGVAALLKSYNFNATPDQIRAAIENTAEDLGSSGWDNRHGHGLINPVGALEYIGGGSGQQPQCQQWTATNDEHVAAGRAYTQQNNSGCAAALDYYAVGSNDYLGVSGTATTTLYTLDNGSAYRTGTCP